jgi:molybdopterin/thiamine biosynthesis adenylyltransferase
MINIKFKLGEMAKLRDRLLADLSNEAFALILAKTERINNLEIIKVIDIIYPTKADYKSRNIAFLNVKENFFIDALKELQSRYDVDTIVDVHTHPFAKDSVRFSHVDDTDEITFKKFLDENFDDIHYASIVFSQNEYSARKWDTLKSKKIVNETAFIKTQLTEEMIKSSDEKSSNNNIDTKMFDRGILALGIDNLRKITSNQKITIVGAGGTGSVIAESLIHMGFNYINLIDNDILEISNMNRIVGAYYQDAVDGKYKVDVIASHLLKINPHATINRYNNDIYDEEMESVLAQSDWIIMATDNHSSRFHAQNIAFKYFVPFLSVGVNITVQENQITDESGEVIVVRMGDRVCLKCLERINNIKVAYEREPEDEISQALLKKGYVDGKDIKEPAVKTLNSILGQMTVDILVNQYTNRLRHQTISVYERNISSMIYEDKESLKNRSLNCAICGF